MGVQLRTFREKELTINEVADDLKIFAYDVFQLINAGKLKAHRFGGHHRVLPKHLLEYKEKLLSERDCDDQAMD